MHYITNFLIWAQILNFPVVTKPVQHSSGCPVAQSSDDTKPVDQQKPVEAVQSPAPPEATVSEPVAQPLSAVSPAPSTTQEANNNLALERSDEELRVPFSKTLKEFLQKVCHYVPQPQQPTHYQYALNRMNSGSREEEYLTLKQAIKECFGCLSDQKNSAEIRALYVEIERCKQELKVAKVLAEFKNDYEIKEERQFLAQR